MKLVNQGLKMASVDNQKHMTNANGWTCKTSFQQYLLKNKDNNNNSWNDTNKYKTEILFFPFSLKLPKVLTIKW